MSLELTTREVEAIWTEAQQHRPSAVSIDRLETICTVPSQLGNGYHRYLELCPGLDLCLVNTTSHDVAHHVPENQHPVQFMAFLSGVYDSGDLVLINAEQGYVGGSGIQPRHRVHSPGWHRHVGVNIHLTSALFQQLFASADGALPPTLQPLLQENDCQHRFSPKMTTAMRTVVQQILACPFVGITKRLYLQGKVFELMALQLDGLLNEGTATPSASPKADTVARIHYAAEILRSHLEQPPHQTELSQRVGLSDRTLQKGFKTVFGLTPFAYLTQQRMHQAEHLLRQPHRTVAEVANMMGYANPAQFAAAFKRQFGLTPRECLRGNKPAQTSLLG
ncbi:AraC family transcriptional regulator [Leptolyngbya sp. CCNP1308]|uniref:helix-turn-helix transcriptional regulator n=1 Tax=Leptolyngbya sp. CCNP1308 TaxID=3110255 RepID=UPI002B1EB0A9|nr:AraC family transcriptional regulator [Leptolyngbya sp. CCNP1308]MEA5451760.1 AraC family transcriptional regulator [Leptolyngbya sp. CCNP1308]